MALTPEQEAAYALSYNIDRESLEPEVQAEYDRQLEYQRRLGARAKPDAIFPALSVQVRGEAVEAFGAPAARYLGQLAGAQAQVTEGSQAWSPGRAMFMPIAFAGLATKTKATAFVVFSDGSYIEHALDENAAVRDAQAEAIRFNAMADKATAPTTAKQDDVGDVLRKLARLYEEGQLTEEEYATKRAEVIARI